nr:MAG: putative coat protein [Leviviridae sp.]
MIGDTITITMGGFGGDPRVLKKINQDNYSSEYMHRTVTDELVLKVRHAKEKARNGAPALDRHNVVLSQRVFATVDSPERYREFYFVYRVAPGDDLSDANLGPLGLSDWIMTIGNIDKIAGWES